MKRLIFATAVVISTTAHAYFFTGNKLMADLAGTDGEQTRAIGYVAGVFDTGATVVHCAPAQVDLRQVVDMVKGYLTTFPAQRNLPADVLVSRMLLTAWPCEAKGKKEGGPL